MEGFGPDQHREDLHTALRLVNHSLVVGQIFAAPWWASRMALHVVNHGGYHRGEVGRIMRQLSMGLPWDTLAVYLHGAEPSRRLIAG